jgi:3-oxoacyl-[acyl-carrier-protein] synthase II
MQTNAQTVITGIGVLSPIGESKEEYWDSLSKNISGIREINLFDASKYGVQRAGEIHGFNPEAYLGKKGLKFLSRTTQLVLSAASLCLIDAGLKGPDKKISPYDAESLGVVLGTSYGVLHSMCLFEQTALLDGPDAVSPMAFPNLVMNCHAGYLAIRENLKGTNMTIATGYNASLDAFGIGVDFLAADHMKCLLIGGVEELSEEFLLSYSKQQILAPGTLIGEGCAVYTVEKLADALERQAKIYGHIAGYGTSFSDTRDGLVKAIKSAFQNAGMKYTDIELVVNACHCNCTQKEIEAEVISSLFGKKVITFDIYNLLGDSYSAGGSLQIAAGLGLISNGSVKTFLTVSQDACGNNSALIIRK